MNEITPEMFNLALMHVNSLGAPIKKIKVKLEFFDYLGKMCPPICLEDLSKSEGIRAEFTGIPIEIDDTIENEYYELVYEEEKEND